MSRFGSVEGMILVPSTIMDHLQGIGSPVTPKELTDRPSSRRRKLFSAGTSELILAQEQ
jgi:hypothetical protein